MILQSESSKSRWWFASCLLAVGGPTAHTCANGFADICDPADSSSSSAPFAPHSGATVTKIDELRRSWVFQSAIFPASFVGTTVDHHGSPTTSASNDRAVHSPRLRCKG